MWSFALLVAAVLGMAFGFSSSFELAVRLMGFFLSGEGRLRFCPGLGEGGCARFTFEEVDWGAGKDVPGFLGYAMLGILLEETVLGYYADRRLKLGLGI